MAERFKLTPNALREVIKAVARRGTAPDKEVCAMYIEAPPGVGKSANVYQSVQELNAEFPCTMAESRASIKDVVDVAGVPWPDRERGVTVFLPPSEIPNASIHGPRGVWFIDDFPNAPPAVQNSFYSYLIPPHRLNDHTLPEGYAIIAAGNRVEDASGVFRMGRALVNRLTIVELEVDKDQWLQWALAKQLHADVIAFHVSPASVTERGGKVVDLLFDFDPESLDVAFPSPRQWEAASRILRMATEDHLPPIAVRGLLQGTVGVEAEHQFETFRRLFHELPDIEPILQGRGSKWMGVKSVDGKYALLTAVLVRSGLDHLGNVLRWLLEIDPEYSILGIKTAKLRFGTSALLSGEHRKEVEQWLAQHAELLAEAG